MTECSTSESVTTQSDAIADLLAAPAPRAVAALPGRYWPALAERADSMAMPPKKRTHRSTKTR